VQQKRASEEDRLGACLGAPGAQAPVRRDQNRSAPVDLGHLLHSGAGHVLQNPRHPPLGEMEDVHLGVPPVQERADEPVIEAKARPALRRAQSGPHEVPLNQAH
jgi:hypothetical protein